MRIEKYIENLDFDHIEIAKFNSNNKIRFIESLGHIKIYDSSSGTEIPNGFVDKDGCINLTVSDRIGISKDALIDTLKSTSDIYYHTDRTVFKESINFYRNEYLGKGKIIDSINIHFGDYFAKTIDNNVLAINEEQVNNLHKLFIDSGLGVSETAGPGKYLGDDWKRYSFPGSFFRNPKFEVFEAVLGLNFLSVNDEYYHLRIESSDDNIREYQIDRVMKLLDNKWNLKKKIVKMTLEEYESLREDYMLPILDDKEQLYYFINSGSVYVPEDKNDDIIISFRSWDNEHGLSFLYNELQGTLKRGY